MGTVCELLITLLRFAIQSRHANSENLAKLDNALRTVSAIDTMIHDNADLRAVLLNSISANDAIDLLRVFSSQEPSQHDSGRQSSTNDICQCIFRQTELHLRQRLTNLVLSLALHSPPKEGDISGVLNLLLKKRINVSSMGTVGPSSSCNVQSSIRSRPTLSLFEADGTPPEKSVSHDWRDNLVRELSRDASRQYESVNRMVGEICRDLEKRCEDAERPFREEQAKRLELEHQLKTLKEGRGTAEDLARQQRIELETINHEKDSLTVELDGLRKDLDSLAHDLQTSREETDRVKSNAEAAARVTSSKSRDQDLAYMATLTGKDEIIDEQRDKIRSVERHGEELVKQLQEAEQCNAKVKESVDNQTAEIQRLVSVLAEAVKDKSTQQARIDDLAQSEAELQTNRDDLVKQLQDASDRHDTVVAESEAEVKALEAKVTHAAEQHEAYEAVKEAEINDLDASHRASYEKWRAELEAVTKQSAATKEQDDKQIMALQRKIAKLRNEREKQTKELADIQEASNNFMKVMGGNNRFAISGAKAARSFSPRRSSIKRPAPDNISPISTVSSPSSKGRSTIKRLQAHRLSPPKAVHARFSNVSPVPNKSVRYSIDDVLRPPRTPLADIRSSQNLGNLTPTQRIEWENLDPRDSGHGVGLGGDDIPRGWHSDDDSFGSENIFTSTAQQQLPALLGKAPPSSTRSLPIDETTTDF